MSSHHFVRDEQEPALLVQDANSVGFSVVGALLEWSPTVIVLEPAISDVISWGIKIDVIVCSTTALNTYKEQLSGQAPVKFLTYNEHEDPMLTAFYFLRSSKYPGVNLLSPPTQSLMTFLKDFHHSLDIVILNDGFRWFYIKAGNFKKWVAKGMRFKIRTGLDTKHLTLKGFEGLNVSGEQEEIIAEKNGSIAVNYNGPFWLAEQCD